MYQRFYGFNEMPFNITPDPRFLYLSPTHQEALEHLILASKKKKDSSLSSVKLVAARRRSAGDF